MQFIIILLYIFLYNNKHQKKIRIEDIHDSTEQDADPVLKKCRI